MPRTLIVEDSSNFRQLLKEILFGRFPCMQVGEAADGKEALQKVDSLKPDIIFMDIKLPGENGLELTQKIKAGDPNITVIVLTSCDLLEYRQAASKYGANYFLSKDTSTEELVKLIELILSERGPDAVTAGRD